MEIFLLNIRLFSPGPIIIDKDGATIITQLEA